MGNVALWSLLEFFTCWWCTSMNTQNPFLNELLVWYLCDVIMCVCVCVCVYVCMCVCVCVCLCEGVA